MYTEVDEINQFKSHHFARHLVQLFRLRYLLRDESGLLLRVLG